MVQRPQRHLPGGRASVINQDTGFSNVFPTGEGLFAFSTMDEILAAVDAIKSDYERHSRAAEEIAREYFAHDVVLGRLIEDLGAELTSGRGYIVRRDAAGPFPADLDITRWRAPDPVGAGHGGCDQRARARAPRAPVAMPTPASVVVVTHDNLLFSRMALEA